MSNRAPDFSATFAIVDDQLEDAERRLRQKRLKKAETAKRVQKEASKTETPPEALEPKEEVKPQEKSAPVSKPVRKRPKGEGASNVELVKREVRRNLTLKVLEENEIRFNQLFHRLQLAGDGRRKQDLADEALGLLFGKYKSLVG